MGFQWEDELKWVFIENFSMEAGGGAGRSSRQEEQEEPEEVTLDTVVQ